ncbi:MAG: hypothetical protein LBR94_05610, partial [Desulfovibrio sp.]|nr:hypothetical protein [Desulfovibrio sp.]
GADEAIIAFQRPQGSGSQTVMLRFMGGTPLQEPLQDQVADPMGGPGGSYFGILLHQLNIAK